MCRPLLPFFAIALGLTSFWTEPEITALEPAGPESIAGAVENPARLDYDRARDETRRPQRILEFFGIQPGMKVADIQGGNGYYTELVSRVVGPQGQVFAVNDAVTQRLYGKQLTERLEREEFDASNVTRIDRQLDEMQLPSDLDRVLLVRFYHDFGWMEIDRAAFNQTIFESLAPGGVFCVIDHHAQEGVGIEHGGTLHRIESSVVREEVEAAGFVLEAESYVLRDETDEHDFNIFENSQARRDRTDRFVYFFRKPEAGR